MGLAPKTHRCSDSTAEPSPIRLHFNSVVVFLYSARDDIKSCHILNKYSALEKTSKPAVIYVYMFGLLL